MRTVPRDPPPAVVAPKVDELASAAPDAAKNLKIKAARRRLNDAAVAEEEPMFTRQTYILGLVILGGGIAALAWRTHRRRLELAATAVSLTPFSTPPGSGSAVRFTPELLAKLEWKRFEELVTSYYSKTGVVAVRTKAGPAKPVHIKISWKGESRPFAYVQCIANPGELIEAGPILELVAGLAADDIRRGYVVTTGKFGVNARDLAEEKHITLLSGDILLEKLNALPDSARAELMQETTAGDFSTPTCPKCEAKMVQSGEDPAGWKCGTHPEQTITQRT